MGLLRMMQDAHEFVLIALYPLLCSHDGLFGELLRHRLFQQLFCPLYLCSALILIAWHGGEA